MYLDLSFRKTGAILLLCAVMAATLVATTNIKEHRYGSTPPFSSIGLAIGELFLRARYTAEAGFIRASQSAGAFAAFVTNKSEFNRTGPERLASSIPVLTYHRIVTNEGDLNNVTASTFRKQMMALKRAGWETITLKQYMEFMAGTRDLPERSFLITFDDGAKESFYPVDPLFAALSYEGVMYVIAAAEHTNESTYYLSPPEIQRMLRTGRWEIGSHSYDGHRPHPSGIGGKEEGIFFADLLWKEKEGRLETPEEFTTRVREDLTLAKKQLEAEYGVEISSFAFPLGNETGIEGSANFPEGAAITENEASRIYSVGFLQTNDQDYTPNFPGNDFISRRIHVDHDWDGERLLAELEQGLQKDVPYEDDFSVDRGWIPAWGSLDFGRDNLTMKADTNASSVSTFLDGSALWDEYSYDASLNWQSGSAFLLADVQNSKTYDACAFSPGLVRVQSTKDGVTKILAEKKDERIAHKEDARLGIRVHGSVIECTWDYDSIIESYERGRSGGIGIQAWNPSLGTAELHVSRILVRPYATSTSS